MSLYRQLVLLITLLLLLTLSGTLWVNFASTRDFLSEQLSSHAQDTATALGLTLSETMEQGDKVTMTSTVDAVFDRGYYRRIDISDVNGNLLLERKQPVVIEDVPHWFIRAVTLNTPPQEAVVMGGWRQVGKVMVWSHPGYAYRKLWQEAIQTALLFVVIGAGLILGGSMALHRLLTPLRRIEEQARLLVKREYVVQKPVPRARELRRVVEAMNALILQIKAMFESQASVVEELRSSAYRDELTGLGNRRYFEGQMQTRLSSEGEVGYGALVLLEIEDLNGINARHGYDAGDRLMQSAAGLAADVAALVPHGLACRLGGATLALILPGLDANATSEHLSKLMQEAQVLSQEELSDQGRPIRSGATLYQRGESLAVLMARADEALRSVTDESETAWALNCEEATARQEWEHELAGLIKAGAFEFMVQTVWCLPDATRRLHREVLIRLPLEGTERILGAGEFLPVAERLGLAGEVDKQVISKAIDYLQKHADAGTLAVNLSHHGLHDRAFLHWFSDTLKSLAQPLRKRLCFELSEYHLTQEMETVRELVALLHRLDVGFGLDHYGHSFSDIAHLHALRPQYIKLDAAYSHNLEQDEDARFLVRALCSALHSLGTEVIAEAVQDRELLILFSELGLSGAQGYALELPQPLK